jgi:hypothetical protein
VTKADNYPARQKQCDANRDRRAEKNYPEMRIEQLASNWNGSVAAACYKRLRGCRDPGALECWRMGVGMNEGATKWVEGLPRRWARNAMIFTPVYALAPFALRFTITNEPLFDWHVFFIVLIVCLVTLIPITYLIGMAARRHLRRLRDVPDGTAASAVRWLPFRYFVWGLVFGYIFFLITLLSPGTAWDTQPEIIRNLIRLLFTMLFVAIFTTIIGFISRTAFRNRLTLQSRP